MLSEEAQGRGYGQQTPSNDPHNNQHNPQYANYWAPLTRKRHIPPHSAQPRHTNDWAPRTRKRHQQEHRPQRPTERSDPTQHAKGRTGDCPGPRKGATTGRNVTRGAIFGTPHDPACASATPRSSAGGPGRRVHLQRYAGRPRAHQEGVEGGATPPCPGGGRRPHWTRRGRRGQRNAGPPSPITSLAPPHARVPSPRT